MFRISSFLLVVAAVAAMTTTNAFVVKAPTSGHVATTSSNTELQFGFLKELGLEKPDWLPDFGGKKEEEEAAAPPAEDEAAAEEESAPADE